MPSTRRPRLASWYSRGAAHGAESHDDHVKIGHHA